MVRKGIWTVQGSSQSVVEAGSWGLDSTCKQHPGVRLWLRWWVRCLSIPPSLLYQDSISCDLEHFNWKPPNYFCFPSYFKLTLSDILPPARSHLLSLPQKLHQLKIKYSNIWVCGGHSQLIHLNIWYNFIFILRAVNLLTMARRLQVWRRKSQKDDVWWCHTKTLWHSFSPPILSPTNTAPRSLLILYPQQWPHFDQGRCSVLFHFPNSPTFKHLSYSSPRTFPFSCLPAPSCSSALSLTPLRAHLSQGLVLLSSYLR